MPYSIDVTFELVTPAYAGGAETSQTDGLRPPTLKALLRFWWRTMHPALSSTELFEQEEKLFGSTSQGQVLRVVPRGPIRESLDTNEKYLPRETIKQNDRVVPNPTFPLFYMAYGTQGDKQSPPRSRTSAGSVYPYRLVSKRDCTEGEWHQILSALWLLTTFGGVGTRSRRGFGGVQIKEVSVEAGQQLRNLKGFPDITDCVSASQVCDALVNGLRNVFRTRYSETPDHTAFSRATRIVVGQPANTWQAALIAAGKVFYQLRRLLGTVYGHRANDLVGEDFDLVTGYGDNPPDDTGNSSYGAAFGLPHNYQFSRSGWKPSFEVFDEDDIKAGCDKGSARRASPVLFRILKLANNHYVPVVVWLPCRFLPDEYEVRFKNGNQTYPVLLPEPDMIHALLDRQTQIRTWQGNKPESYIPFKGYLGLGWQEVVW